MTIDGGSLISATKTVEIRTLGPQFWIAGPGGEVSTTEEPVFESETLDEPALMLPLQRDLDGVWHGDWRWSARVSCEGKSLCDGFEEVPFRDVPRGVSAALMLGVCEGTAERCHRQLDVHQGPAKSTSIHLAPWVSARRGRG